VPLGDGDGDGDSVGDDVSDPDNDPLVGIVAPIGGALDAAAADVGDAILDGSSPNDTNGTPTLSRAIGDADGVDGKCFVSDELLPVVAAVVVVDGGPGGGDGDNMGVVIGDDDDREHIRFTRSRYTVPSSHKYIAIDNDAPPPTGKPAVVAGDVEVDVAAPVDDDTVEVNASIHFCIATHVSCGPYHSPIFLLNTRPATNKL
jgi:hypothetical protein